ncbi:MAG: corrinoid protein [Clostridiales bacterium]|nr:corrinoid protein [Clostridiales bacterium]
MDLKEILNYVERGNAKKTKELVTKAIEEGIPAVKILNEGLISAMSAVGERFKEGEIYVPEMLIAGRAMSQGMKILEPILTKTGVKAVGRAVMGTVKGDLHDIGKNLVIMMLKGTGIEVYDLGVDVPKEVFAQKAEELHADIIAMSALLTTTMPAMKDVVEELKKRNIRNKYIVMIGGAPVTDEYAKEIGADYYTADAATAAEVAKKALIERQN